MLAWRYIEVKQTEVSVHGIESEMFLVVALAIDVASAIEVQSDSPGHAALGLALVRAAIFWHAAGFFLLWNVQF